MRIHAWASGLFLAAIIVACGSESDSTFGDGNVDGGSSGSSGSLIPPVNTEGGTGPQVLGACGRTCADQGVKCGPAGDGCGGLIQCGTCNAPDTCGGAGKPSECGSGGTTCTPKTCADFPANSCGPLADGCGGLITCGGCTSPQICGGGGTASVCGGNDGCIPKTVANCATAGVQCGPMADGCGGSVDCGSCGVGQSCGVGGPSKCGTAGGGSCTPKQCSDFGINCGPAGDGCGDVLDCGTCTAPQTCGGGGVPSKCGGNSGCVAKTCLQLGISCGAAGDGCGGQLDCGPCIAPKTCGGGGTPSVCGGTNACVPRTAADCAGLGFNCGLIADGCGGPPVQCGATCPTGAICGATSPNVCSTGGACVGAFCNNVSACAGQPHKTRITGVVYAPNGTLPLPGAKVYVPNGAATQPWGITNINAGVTPGVCDTCNSTLSGSPLVSTDSGTDGSFTLDGVPDGVSFPLVIQMGKWRGFVTIPAITACGSYAADGQGGRVLVRFPTKQGERDGANAVKIDNIPLVALSTGSVDAMECVYKKLGVDTTQFTIGTGNGRIRLYTNSSGGGSGETLAGITAATNLYGSAASLDAYDAVIMSCGGPPGTWADNHATERNRMKTYADNGGRLFATHYQYEWLFETTEWGAGNNVTPTGNPPNSTVKWTLGAGTCGGPGTGCTWIGEVLAGAVGSRQHQFYDWLAVPGVAIASLQNNPRRITLVEPRRDASEPVASNSEEWIKFSANGVLKSGSGGSGTGGVLHYTFNTPVNPAVGQSQCGRVLYSDFHVSPPSGGSNVTFPTACGASNAMSDQEKILAFFLFDLTSCITTATPSCTPKTCANYPAGTCGVQSDGCGGSTANCGNCVAPQTCGGGGTANVCGGTACVPRSCAQENSSCGPTADGCGGIQDCGPCVAPQTCGGGGIANKCGNPSCIPTTCAAQGITCGPAGDGCGGEIASCGDCVAPLICGGGGTPGVCGNAVCTKQTCQALGAECGPVGDGCGGLIPECGPCPPGQVCGGGGPSKCGVGSCTPRTCQQAGATCGPIGDGCGGQVDCGPCTQPGQTCGGGGAANVCGGCTRTTCQAAGAECGPIGDGCGGEIDCGPCTRPGDTCGGGGTPFKCGQIGVK